MPVSKQGGNTMVPQAIQLSQCHARMKSLLESQCSLSVTAPPSNELAKIQGQSSSRLCKRTARQNWKFLFISSSAGIVPRGKDCFQYPCWPSNRTEVGREEEQEGGSVLVRLMLGL